MARILVVDDSATVVRFVQLALSRDGHHVYVLDSFIQLSAEIRDDPPDLLLLDLNIPALSGEAMGELVRRHQRRDVPIVIYSSEDDAAISKAATLLHAAAVLRKGADPGALRSCVKRVLDSTATVHGSA